MKQTTRVYLLIIIVTIVGVTLTLTHASFAGPVNVVVGAIDLLALLVLLQNWRRRGKSER